MSWCDAVLFCNRLSEKEGLEPCYVIPDGLESACRKQSSYDDDSVNALSKEVKWNKSANGYRLPTEAEWEYCGRGGEEHLYSGSNNVDEVAWYEENSEYETHIVGEKKGNGFGLYDMSGNVWEWVWDSESRKYGSSTADPSYRDKSHSSCVYRGGGWGDSAEKMRVSNRNGIFAIFRFIYLGFRFVRNLS